MAANRRKHVRKTINLTDRIYFKEAQKGKQYVTPIIIGRSTGKPIIIFSTPVFKEGTFDGLIFSSISLNHIAHLILSQNFGENGRFRLFYEKGYSIIPDEGRLYSLKLSSQKFFNPSDFNTKDEILKINEIKDGDILYATPLTYSKLYIGGSLNIEEIMKTSQNMIKTTLLSMLLFTSAGLLLFWLFFKKISTSLQILDRNLLSISEGTYDPCSPEDLKHLPIEIRKIAFAVETLKKKVKVAITKISELAIRDPLTGLNNRLYFEQSLEKLAAEDSDSVTILICDVNGLKLINDALGHSWGDLLLKRTAEVLKNTSDPDDIVARIGGDEFAIIRPESTSTSEENMTRRFKQALIEIQKKIPFVPVHIAWGISQKKTGGKDLFEVAKDADEKMYSLKEHQRKNSRKSIINFFMAKIDTEATDYSLHMKRCKNIIELFLKNIPDITPEFQDKMIKLAAIHDIGIAGAPSKLTHKSNPLAIEQRRKMQTHPEIGYRITMNISDLSKLAEPILYHHRWWNGGGYPVDKTLYTGESIPLESRILALIDFYEIVTSQNNRSKLEHYEAIDEIKRLSGTRFDPLWAKHFVVFLETNYFKI